MSFWSSTYFAPLNADRLRDHGDFAATRARFFGRAHSNLRFLVRERYDWMSPYLAGRSRVVELGAGPGLSREFLRAPGLEITDVLDNPWLDRRVDAMALPYEPGSLDAVICSHMIHHVPAPVVLLRQIARCLKPGGLLLVNETTTSLTHRLLMWAMRHEGWSYDVDIFDDASRSKPSVDPRSGNNAVANLLFNDRQRLSALLPDMSIVRDEFTELLVFLVSGGVGGQVFTIELPEAALRLIRGLDNLLVRVAPPIFALARRLVLERSRTNGP